MENYVYISSISIFSPFSFFYYDFIIYIDFIHIAQQLMTSQIRSYIEYLKRTYTILVLIL